MLKSKWNARFILLSVAVIFMQLSACTNKDNNDNPNRSADTDAIGTWNGVVADSYFCESGAESIQLVVTDSDITMTIGAGTITWHTSAPQYNASGYSLKFTVQDSSATPTQSDRTGQINFDSNFKYGVVVMQSHYAGNSGYIGVITKAPTSTVSYSEPDLAGSWSGHSLQIDANFNLQSSDTSDLTVTDTTDGLDATGTDGALSIIAAASTIGLSDSANGIYSTNAMLNWGSATKSGLLFQSFDKKAIAAGFIDGLCNYSLFDTLDQQKFFLWTKQ